MRREVVLEELNTTDQRVAAAGAAGAGVFGQGWLMVVGQPKSLFGLLLLVILAIPGWYLFTLVWRVLQHIRERGPSTLESWVFGTRWEITGARLVETAIRGFVLLIRVLLCAAIALPATLVCLFIAVQPWRWRRT